jgi:hypothetical protein
VIPDVQTHTALLIDIDASIAAFISRRPALAGVLRPFGAIWRERRRIIDQLALAPVDVRRLGLCSQRLSLGVPLLSEADCRPLESALKQSVAGLLPAISAALPAMATEIGQL